MIIILFYILLFVILLYGLYFLVTSFFTIKKRNKKILNKPTNSKFAIIIAARNEEDVIENLIKSLKNQNYPSKLFEIYVVPNNCTDNTEKIAKEAGANIIKCTVTTKSKGEVLKYAFEKLKNKKNIDAYIIFDADNIVHPQFLKNMDEILNENYKVAQGFRDSKNPCDNWLSCSYSIFYWIQNIFFNRSRMKINGSASINGTGFMIKKEIIDKFGFNTITLTEDMEFTAQCALNNIKIAFVEDAITYDEQPTDFKQSWKQRIRWSIGNMQCFKKYGKKLLNSFIVNKNVACLDMLLVFSFPYFQLIFIILYLYRIFFIKEKLIIDLFVILLIYFINILINIYVIKYNNKQIKKLLSGIFLFMFFTLTWIPINFICLFKKDLKWEQIKHNRNIKIDEIIK